ncbi:tRNA pseudouridine(55) synthase TruB [Marinoscillum sp. MHG1-6]|uniref:tRNA pseudouridine(55) synthase TruB n=1 Tax=Marinoscillum sp. MHG1-6 TaxID=2959627 RepID=UPI002157036D|nr:tRNA pseudouridine(55) synthase TruB [Marinoscillum sp. MHG1-6]
MAGVDLSEGVLLLVDKPLEWTSFDVVNKLRYALKVKKIGHAGTLDPLATGLLLIGVGKFTKKLNELQGLDKVYEGIFEIGKTTPSYDLETSFDSEADISGVSLEQVLAAAKHLTGPQDQIPPAFSAIRIKGERAYHKARNNETVKLDPRPVIIHEFDVPKFENGEVHFRIRCSKGTYIRSIARDLGNELGVGAYLKKLRRTEIGEYHVKDAQLLEDVITEYRSADS